ncbi:MAG: type VI secretion system tip protein TssI/VgrG [Myxococcota bacterium]
MAVRRIQALASIPGSPGFVEVRAVRGEERLSEPFRYEIDLDMDTIDIDQARGQLAQLTLIEEFGSERHVSGAIDRIEVLGTDEPRSRWRLYLIPVPELLRYRKGQRIFQEMTTPDIVKKVFTDAGVPDSMFRWDTYDTYVEREYCVQYDESEWDFVCRLLEDEGIWFAFDHGPDGHVMVFGDKSDKVEPAAFPALSYQHSVAAMNTPEPHVWHWRQGAELSTAKATVNDFDFARPSLPMKKEATATAPFERDYYEYPAGYYEPTEGERRAEVRLQELRSRAQAATGVSHAIGLLPGSLFELVAHPYVTGEFVVTACRLTVRLVEATLPSPLTELGPPIAEVAFECVPKAQIYRPRRRTPRPKIAGFQTARVVGPAGEEIHTDEHGRVKVQFHWDREGQADEQSSCWIRVGQAHTTGSVMIPRIGWEVLVQFLEGDPDRPLLHGRLFNPLTMPLYPLPDNKTVSAHRSGSSPGGGGFNEVMFDDAAGTQQVRISGHRDITVATANNKRRQIVNNQNHSVGANRVMNVGSNEETAVEATSLVNIGGNETVQVGVSRDTKVNAGCTVDVTGTIGITVGGMQNILIGNPIQGALQVITAHVVEGAAGAAASAAQRAAATAMGPIMPALSAAQETLGPAAQMAGSAAAMFSGGDPTTAVFGSTLGALSGAAGAEGVGQIAGQVAASVASGALAKAGVSAAAGGPSEGGSGGGGGTGAFNVVVAENVTETVGALGAMATAYNLQIGVGGNVTENIGAARIELVKSGKAENIGAAKAENVGIYMLDAKDGIAVDAKAGIAINVASQQQKIGGGHSITAGAAGVITTTKLTLAASDTVTLKCGQAEVVVSSKGLSLKGATGVTVKASTIEMKPPVITPGM